MTASTKTLEEVNDNPSRPVDDAVNIQVPEKETESSSLLQITMEENEKLRDQVILMEKKIAALQLRLGESFQGNKEEATITNHSNSNKHAVKLNQTKQLHRGSDETFFQRLLKRFSQSKSGQFQALREDEEQNENGDENDDVFVIDDDEEENKQPRNIVERLDIGESLEADLERGPDQYFLHQTFWEQLKDRSSWLVGLLILQSCSSFILKRNEDLLESHLDIYNFLTMLVGAGGNAGNQACVRVIRELALGTLNSRQSKKSFLFTEFKMGICLSLILAVSGLGRALFFGVSLSETYAITTSLWTIVFISVTIGALLPLLMSFVGIDPAHSSTTIQVIMDILGVTLTVVISSLILGSVKVEEA